MPRTAKSINDSSLLEAALEGLELQKARLEDQIAEVRRRLGRDGHRAKSAQPAQKDSAPKHETARKPLSAAARKRIAAAQKKRWAAFRQNSEGKTAKREGGRGKKSAAKAVAAAAE